MSEVSCHHTVKQINAEKCAVIPFKSIMWIDVNIF